MAEHRAPRRLSSSLRRHGPRRLVALAATKTLRAIYLSQQHIWFQRDLHGLAEPAAESDWKVRRATDGDLRLLDDLPGASRRLVGGYRTGGADVWVILDGSTPVFVCLTFPRRAPVAAASGGWLLLPPATVVLEDSLTHPAYRGQSVAPRAWDQIAAVLAREGVRHMLTKVGEENTPSRRAVQKAGFREIARMRWRRIGPLDRLDIEPLPGEPLAGHLMQALRPSSTTREVW